MEIPPIEIDITDNWRFTQVALFVDQVEFLSDIAHGRNRLKVSSFLIPRDEVDFWSEQADMFKVKSGQTKEQLLSRFPLIEQFVWDMLVKYKKTSQFRGVIRYALLSGLVKDEDLPMRSVHMRLIDQEEYARTWIAGIRYPTEFAIILSPETTEEDLRNIYKTEFRTFAQHHKQGLNAEHKVTSSHTKGNFHDARKWYWLHKRGLTFAEVARRDILHRKPGIDKESLVVEVRTISSGIGKAIKRYDEALQASSLFKNADN